MKFNELNINNSLLQILDELGFENATPIQQKTFAPIMSGKDITGIAQTGTGKTLAFLLPLIRMHKYSTELHPKVLIIVPTRELVLQIVRILENLTTNISLRIFGVYGGTNIKTQTATILQGLDFLVATPGRLLDLHLNGSLRLTKIKKLVIDEVDEMLNLGFKTQLNTLLDILPERKQSLLFSATMSDDVEEMIKIHFIQPVKIQVDLVGSPILKIKMNAYEVLNFNTKINLLEHLIVKDKTFKKLIIFCKTKRFASYVFEKMTEENKEKFSVIHSNKSQNQRIKAIEAFEQGTILGLISTDILARGLDLEDVSHIINFDTPETPINYMHRVGRTGRAGKRGIATTFFTTDEKENFEAIGKFMNKEIEVLEFPEEVKINEELIFEEEPINLADKNYLEQHVLKSEGGAFHEKKDKNKKVNRAQEKRNARKAQKRKAKRKKKK